MNQSAKIILSSVGLIACVLLLVFAQSSAARFYILEHLAPLNDRYISYHLAKCYYKGFGVDCDLKQAKSWYKKSASKGYARAHYKLGNLYSHRQGQEMGAENNPDFWVDIPLNYKKAFHRYSLASDAGHLKGCCQVAYFHFKGFGVPRDHAAAFKWYSHAAAKGSPLGCTWLGCFYSHGAGLEEGKEEPSLLDRWGGVKLDYPTALKYYTMAAEMGNLTAQTLLGYFYSHGEAAPEETKTHNVNFTGLEKNLNTAIKWYTLAAEQGDLIAQYYLGYWYLNVQRDQSRAFSWFLRAAQHGFGFAQCWVGSLYYTGNGVQEDFLDALAWYSKAAEQGDSHCQHWIGWCYKTGLFLTQDYEQALGWYKESAKNGEADAAFDVARLEYRDQVTLPENINSSTLIARLKKEVPNFDLLAHASKPTLLKNLRTLLRF